MKIQNITINKYKAFQRSETIAVGGKNVFIYGENGSGKSSVYYALKDFFQSSVETIKMADLRNLFLNDGNTDCSVEVGFDNGNSYFLNESSKNTAITSITDANRLKSFLTYKHLLGVHNFKLDNELNIFDLVVEGVLRHFRSQTVTGGIELIELWNDVVNESKIPYGQGKYYHARQKRIAMEERAIRFNNALDRLFFTGGSDYLGPAVNNILAKLFPDLEINFLRHRINVDNKGKISKPKIALQITSGGISLDSHRPHFSLNEAKLSAIAIGIFLGTIVSQSRFSKDIKILFLDDILIGLDNENRLKLIQLLKGPEFRDFQIFVTTYDRHWYEVAKVQLSDWKFLEFYKGVNGPEINDDVKTDIQKAEIYKNSYDYPAAANSLRKELEKTLKDKLPETYSVSEDVKGLLKPPSLETLINRLKLYYKEVDVDIPEKLIDGLKVYKTILLNPMSHDDIQSPIYKNDIDEAFKVIDDLKKIKLPSKLLVIEKNQIFNINLPAISYVAEVILANNVYKIDNDGTITFTIPEFIFLNWERLGVNYAKMTGNPPAAYTKSKRLDILKRSPYKLDKIIVSINRTYDEQGQPLITVSDLKNAMSCEGKNLTQLMI
ncbi:AAA family ATPase [Flagellimonas meishanensis]|uniref:AAA family ATPase n=1 Tax=Flagellimonas meishanensis TaxID=2873264 RepID=UPI001CA6CEEB|nr:AAA family ATPase [[Muricauda] meishanensis]